MGLAAIAQAVMAQAVTPQSPAKPAAPPTGDASLQPCTPASCNVPGEAAIRSVLVGGVHPDIQLWDVQRWREPLLQLYAARRFAPLWFSEHQMTRPATTLLAQMRAAEQRGLRSTDYDADDLTQLFARKARPPALGAEEVAFLDVALSIAAARLVSDLHFGRVAPREVGYDLDVPRDRADIGSGLTALSTTADTESLLDSFEPGFSHYVLLKRSLAKYRALASQPDLNRLPPLAGSRALKPGSAYEGAAALRKLLTALGDLAPPSAAQPTDPAPVLDASLTEGLEHFQARHGFKPDGVLGMDTFRALTTPFEQRVRQIELSLERWRWLPPKLETAPIIVNIPEFRLFAFYTTQDTESAMLRMDVIVGKSFRQTETPVFAADMRYVVLNPYWDVPYSILVRELLPNIRKNPAWVAQNDYEIVRGQGDDALIQPATPANIAALAAGALRLRQRPGRTNALGFVKFMLPNQHNVYLHSTPAQSLFSQARRAFSHGCIRVGDPMALFGYVMRSDPSWTRERVMDTVRGGKTTRIQLAKPLRVFIVYATALAAEDGRTLFFNDIYGHDARLAALLEARHPISRART